MLLSMSVLVISYYKDIIPKNREIFWVAANKFDATSRSINANENRLAGPEMLIAATTL
jgi:hypothetical protein